MFRIVKFLKDLLFRIPFLLIFYPLSKVFNFIAHFNKLTLWIYKNKKGLIYCDFFSPVRDYQKRFKLYQAVADHFELDKKKVTYLEFGVAAGSSFRWWIEKNNNPESSFFGFDTFAGLPEDWGGFYSKGDMSADVPAISDKRGKFVKGLFQDTLHDFINAQKELLGSAGAVRVIHMDADLYTATIFALSQVYPYLKKGDIIFFDEFNVALHEFKAFSDFTSAFYVKLKPVASVNNFYQTAFVVE
jgi:O-methyltransferase